MKVRSESRVLESWQFKPQLSPFVKKKKEKKLKGKLEGPGEREIDSVVVQWGLE